MQTVWHVLVSSSDIKRGCEKCDRGHIRIPKTEGLGFTYESCDCAIERESLLCSRKLLRLSNISERLQKTCLIENWDEPKILSFEFLLKFMESEALEDNWLFLHGPTGSGKTYSAIILAQIALAKEIGVYFTGVPELLDNLRPNNLSPDLPDRTMYIAKNMPVLILDDIGHEKASPWVKEQLYLILNHRWNKGLVTVLTSNFPIENLKETLSEAIYSRVKGQSFDKKLVSISDKRIHKPTPNA